MVAIPFATDWTQVIYTAATILILIVAVWGDQIRLWFSSAKFAIEANAPIGLLIKRNDGRRVWFFHLRIRNLRPGTTGIVRVCCTRIEKVDSQGRWIPEVFPERLIFFWAYSDVYGAQRTVGDEAALDFAYVDYDSTELRFAFAVVPNNVSSAMKVDEKARLHLGVEVNGYLQPERTVIEICWNGNWSDDASDMFKNVNLGLLETAP
jgi:hypothetical protein